MSSLFLQGKVSICNNYGQIKTNLNELPDGFIQYPQVILTKLLVGGSGLERKKYLFLLTLPPSPPTMWPRAAPSPTPAAPTSTAASGEAGQDQATAADP